MRWKGSISLAALCPLLSGCIVLRSTYDTELAHRQAVEADLVAAQTRSAELDRERRDLAQKLARRELERESLGKERVDLLNELEDLRMERDALGTRAAAAEAQLAERLSALEQVQGSYRSLVDQLEGEVDKGQIEIQRLRGRLQIRALEQILFDSGSADLKAEGRGVLAKVAAQLAGGGGGGGQIRVEGHTDDVPISNERFPSNWHLSVGRAVTVVQFLVAQGVAPSRLAAVGMGEHHPIADNGSPEGRARNRRIEIVLLPEGEE